MLVDVGQDADMGPAVRRGERAGGPTSGRRRPARGVRGRAGGEGARGQRAVRGQVSAHLRSPEPVVAEAVAGIARNLGAEAVVHGCTGKGNDQVRFELAFKATYPGVRVIAPLRDHLDARRGDRLRAGEADPRGGEAGVALLDRRQPVRAGDRGRRAGGPVGRPSEEAFELTAAPSEAPEPEEVVVSFEAGLPVALDGGELPLADLVSG